MPQESRPRVLLADDHAGILTALRRLLEPSCDVVACVTNGAALLEAAAQLQPDVVVLDVTMPEINGLEACRQIREAMPHTKVVVLTAVADPGIEQKALRLGASAFVPKYWVADHLLPAIQKAFTGETQIY